MHLRFGPEKEKWVLDQTSIFAQVDAFVQRCKDLLEVSKFRLPSCLIGHLPCSLRFSTLDMKDAFLVLVDLVPWY